MHQCLSLPPCRNAGWLQFLPICTLAAAVLPAGCSRPSAGGVPTTRPAAAVPVLIEKATRNDVPIQLQAIGRVEPFSTVTVRPQVSGQISKVHFIEGMEVKAGDLLFSIDPRPFEAALRRAEAELARDTAMARDAQEEAKRQAELFEKLVATEREHNQAQANADAMQATVRADMAAVEAAKLRLGYCSIVSPITGRTGRRIVDSGNIVQENETALVVINQIAPIHVAFSVPEQHLSDIKARMTATAKLPVFVSIPALSEPPEEGALAFLDNQVDADTGTVRLKARFENDRRRLWPGQFVQVALTLGTHEASTVVPVQAVQTGQKGEFVYVVRDDRTVEMREVMTGDAYDGHIIIRKGVEPGETVVTDGQLRLAPGSLIEVKQGLASAGQAGS